MHIGRRETIWQMNFRCSLLMKSLPGMARVRCFHVSEHVTSLEIRALSGSLKMLCTHADDSRQIPVTYLAIFDSIFDPFALISTNFFSQRVLPYIPSPSPSAISTCAAQQLSIPVSAQLPPTASQNRIVHGMHGQTAIQYIISKGNGEQTAC